jgi:hypothetical protein
VDEIAKWSPDEWAATIKEHHLDTWRMLAQVYRSAVMLYALGALGIVTPGTPRSATHEEEYHHMAGSLTELMLTIPNTNHSTLTLYGLMWPTIMAGVFAATVAERTMTQEVLMRIGRACGMVSPLAAKQVLEDFWCSGKQGWDECFKIPHSFLT